MSIVINRVYTGAGDQGTTRLVGGQERKKTDSRIEAYGTIDELNACLGLCAESLLAANVSRELSSFLRRIQNELFDLGGELATLPENLHEKQILVSEDDIARLEKEMDDTNQTLPTLRSFILPGGSLTGAFFHQARCVARRAERVLVALHETEPLRPEVLRYVNRLSDWLFVMGRKVVVEEGGEEVLWKPGARS